MKVSDVIRELARMPMDSEVVVLGDDGAEKLSEVVLRSNGTVAAVPKSQKQQEFPLNGYPTSSHLGGGGRAAQA